MESSYPPKRWVCGIVACVCERVSTLLLGRYGWVSLATLVAEYKYSDGRPGTWNDSKTPSSDKPMPALLPCLLTSSPPDQFARKRAMVSRGTRESLGPPPAPFHSFRAIHDISNSNHKKSIQRGGRERGPAGAHGVSHEGGATHHLALTTTATTAAAAPPCSVAASAPAGPSPPVGGCSVAALE